jgi:DNA-binding response OmpR family regulator
MKLTAPGEDRGGAPEGGRSRILVIDDDRKLCRLIGEYLEPLGYDIVGLEIGADDYLPKTFSTRELLARLRAVTRRSARPLAPDEEREIVVGSLRLNLSARTAVLGDVPVVLTPVEFELLAALGRSSGRVKTREQLVAEVRSRDYDVFDRSIDVHIAALRRKLGDDAKEPRFIRTLRAVGYMLVNPDE